MALMTIMDAIPRQSRRYPRPVNTLTFTMAQHMDNVEVYLQVLRYQGKQ